MDNEKDNYVTQHLDAAAYLMARGHELLGIDPRPASGRLNFRFPEAASIAVQAFYQDGAVPAMACRSPSAKAAIASSK